MIKSRLKLIITLLVCFLFLTGEKGANSILPTKNVLMSDKPMIDFGHNKGTGIFDDGSNDEANETAEESSEQEEPSESATEEKPAKKKDQYRVRICGNRIFWGTGDENFDQNDYRIELDKLQENISVKCVAGTILYFIDDYAESKTYRDVLDIVSKKDRKYTLVICPDTNQKYWSMKNAQ